MSAPENRVTASLWPGDPKAAPALRNVLSQVGDFLESAGLPKSLAALEKETQKKGLKIDPLAWRKAVAEGKDRSRSLMQLWHAPAAGKQDDSSDASSSDSSSDSSDSDSSDGSSSGAKSPAQGGQKRKRSATPSSSSASSSDSGSGSEKKDDSSSSDSESDSSSSSSSSDARPAKKAKTSGKVKKAGKKGSSSGSDSSSSSSSDSDSSESASSSSDFDSSSDSDSSSSSASSSASPPPAEEKQKKAAKGRQEKKDKNDKKDKKASAAPSKVPQQEERIGSATSSSATLGAETPPEEEAEEGNKHLETIGNGDIHPSRLSRVPEPTPTQKGPNGKPKQVPFSRIPADQKVDPRFASNNYVSYDYADRAHNDLIVTKGKGFTKEKNKKKRGSYHGGAIDLAPKGIKFDD